MEKLTLKKMKIERREPDSEPKWGILKYLSAKFFTKNQRPVRAKRRTNAESNDTCQWHLRSKIGVWHRSSLIIVMQRFWAGLAACSALVGCSFSRPLNHCRPQSSVWYVLRSCKIAVFFYVSNLVCKFLGHLEGKEC